MSQNVPQARNRMLVLGGLGIALLIAVFLSPLASKNPDGLARVSQDLKFDLKEAKEKPAQKLPFYAAFDEYALRGVPQSVATPLAGLVGTIATFGLTVGIGKLAGRGASKPEESAPEQMD
jgi:cobalt/nickel transport protein